MIAVDDKDALSKLQECGWITASADSSAVEYTLQKWFAPDLDLGSGSSSDDILHLRSPFPDEKSWVWKVIALQDVADLTIYGKQQRAFSGVADRREPRYVGTRVAEALAVSRSSLQEPVQEHLCGPLAELVAGYVVPEYGPSLQ